MNGKNMATAQVTPNHDSVQVEILIAAPPARVFQAITDPAQTTQWWGQKGLYRITKSHADVRPGGTWYTSGVGSDGTEFTVSGTYLEIDPPRLLVHTWIPSYSGLQETTVRWELEPHEVHGLHGSGTHRVGTGTMVRVRHSGFAGHLEQAQSHQNGWGASLGWLKSFIETGETFQMRK